MYDSNLDSEKMNIVFTEVDFLLGKVSYIIIFTILIFDFFVV